MYSKPFVFLLTENCARLLIQLRPKNGSASLSAGVRMHKHPACATRYPTHLIDHWEPYPHSKFPEKALCGVAHVAHEAQSLFAIYTRPSRLYNLRGGDDPHHTLRHAPASRNWRRRRVGAGSQHAISDLAVSVRRQRCTHTIYDKHTVGTDSTAHPGK